MRQFALRQTLVSGTSIFGQLAEEGVEPVGWPGPAIGESYALSLRRDRVCRIGGPEMAEGWDAARGLAVSDISGAMDVFELEGPGALDLLRHGTELHCNSPSASVVRIWSGMEVWIYAHAAPDRFRLHVTRARSEALWHSLARAMIPPS